MYPKSAKSGSITWNGSTVYHAQAITVNRSKGEIKYASSSTQGEMSRIAGHGDKSGSFRLLEKPSFNQGDIETLVIKEDSGVTAFNGRAMIISIEEGIPIEDEAGMVTYQVTWGQAPKDENDSSSSGD